MDVAGRGNVGDSATCLYINEVLISSAKVAVIVRSYLTLLVLVCFSCFWLFASMFLCYFIFICYFYASM